MKNGLRTCNKEEHRRAWLAILFWCQRFRLYLSKGKNKIGCRSIPFLSSGADIAESGAAKQLRSVRRTPHDAGPAASHTPTWPHYLTPPQRSERLRRF